MNSKFKIFDTIAEWQAAELGSNVVSLIREDNSIRYSGGYATYPDASTITKILRINNQDITPDSNGRIDIGEVITQHQDISHLASKNELASKQDVIDDLIDIRENSELAENSVQKIIANNIEYNALNGEIDLGSIVNSVKTINGQSIEGSGDIEISVSQEQSGGIHVYNMSTTNPEEEFQSLVTAFESGSFILLGGEYNENVVPVYSGLIQAVATDENGLPSTFAYFVTTAIKYDEMGITDPYFTTQTIIISSSGTTEESAVFTIKTTGDGSRFLSDDGTYKTAGAYIFDPNKDAATLYSELGELVDGNTPIFCISATNAGVMNGAYFAPVSIMFYSDKNMYKVYTYSISSDWDETTQTGADMYITGVYYVTESEVTTQGNYGFRPDLFAKTEDLAAVATTGSYNDLTDKPTIPSEVTETTVSDWGFTKNTGTITGVSANGTSVATSGVANIPAATTGKYGVTKLSSSTSSTSTTLAATASAVKAAYDLANGKYSKPSAGIPTSDLTSELQSMISNSLQSTEFGDLESIIQTQAIEGSLSGIVVALPQEATGDEDDVFATRSTLKTINGQSLLGSGDITISGEGSSSSDNENAIILDAPTSCNLTPGVLNIILATNANPDELTVSYSIDFLNPLTANEIKAGQTREWRLLFDYYASMTYGISFPDNVIWANGNTPVFDAETGAGAFYEFSFIQGVSGVVSDSLHYLGTWSSYSV